MSTRTGLQPNSHNEHTGLFSGPPGGTKSTTAKVLAREAGMIWLPVDSIDGALAASTLRIT